MKDMETLRYKSDAVKKQVLLDLINRQGDYWDAYQKILNSLIVIMAGLLFLMIGDLFHPGMSFSLDRVSIFSIIMVLIHGLGMVVMNRKIKNVEDEIRLLFTSGCITAKQAVDCGLDLKHVTKVLGKEDME